MNEQLELFGTCFTVNEWRERTGDRSLTIGNVSRYAIDILGLRAGNELGIIFPDQNEKSVWVIRNGSMNHVRTENL